jgi:hypothetical protein
MTLGELPMNEANAMPPRRVALVFFGPTLGFVSAIASLLTSEDWEDVLKDPYLLVNFAFESWFGEVDNISWDTLERTRNTEMVCSAKSPPQD